jgi:hypothetical protein
VQLILHERERNGPSRPAGPAATRAAAAVEQARILIRVGALRFTGQEQAFELLWDLTLLHRPAHA